MTDLIGIPYAETRRRINAAVLFEIFGLKLLELRIGSCPNYMPLYRSNAANA